jgi:hypothetical protein
MEARPPVRTAPRFWTALQPSIVRVYKIAGLVALTAILVGLLGFLTVNIFYFFDTSWVRPVIIDSSHEKVVEVTNQLADAKLRAGQLATEKLEVDAQLKDLDLVVQTDEKFIAEVGNAVDAPKSPEQWLLRREVDRAKLDKQTALGKRIPLEKRLENIKIRIVEQDKIIKRLEQSPFLKAADHSIVLAFVPYKNLEDDVTVGSKLYGCSWGLVRCSSVGKVTAILDGEVNGTHPHNDSAQRGRYIEIEVHGAAAGSSVLFAGGKPLWIF